MKTLVAIVALVAVILGGAGAATLLMARRVSALLPGGLQVQVLRYNPYSGHLLLTGLSGRDASGRLVFEADSVEATADPLALLAGAIVVRKVHVASPRVLLPATPGVELVDVAAVLNGRRGGGAAAPPLVIEGLMITEGAIVVEQAGEGGAALVIHNVDVRLNRLAATAPQADLAFAVDMALYGTNVQLTGQPMSGGPEDSGGYAVHVRARGLDLAALLRDFPLGDDAALERGSTDVEGDVMLTGGRLLVSGHARIADVVAHVPGLTTPVRAASATVVVDRFDLARRSGRLSRIDLAGLSVTLARPADGWGGLRQRLQERAREHDIVVRRLRVTDSTVTLVDDSGRYVVRGLDLALSTSERPEDGAIGVTARATLGRQGIISLSGAMGRDLRALDAVVTAERLDVAPWRTALGAPSGEYDGLLGFDGRIRFEDAAAGPRARVWGQATLTNLRITTQPGVTPAFHADSVTATVRRFDWPAGRRIVDSVTFTRPRFTSGAQGLSEPWPDWLAVGAVTVIDGRVSGEAGVIADALSVEAQAIPELGGAARVRLSAVVGGAVAVGQERWLPGETTERGEIGMPLSALFAAVGAAYQVAPSSALSALPREVVAP
ncbi:MAG TPA: DUF748 domain-containing protein [Methylomirabilota bacterium]|jgi:hypothetical protein|nr:DUF748 domain-containing protein [Methylomirabilota bacterium]